MAIRHAVSLRDTFALLSVDSAEAVSVRFLAEFTLNTFAALSVDSVNVLGMTFRVRLLRFTRNDDSYLCSWVEEPACNVSITPHIHTGTVLAVRKA